MLFSDTFFRDVNSILLNEYPDGLFNCNAKKDKYRQPSYIFNDWIGSLSILYSTLFKGKPLLSAIKTTLQIKRSNAFLPSHIIIKRTLNGFILLDKRRRMSFKVADVQLEPDFYSNCITGRVLHGDIAHLSGELTRTDKYCILKQDLLPIDYRLNWNEWGHHLPSLTRKLLSNCRAHDAVTVVSTETLITTIYSIAEKSLIECTVCLQDNMHSVFTTIKKLIKFSLREPESQFDITLIQFAHGDLTPDNYLVSNGRNYLIDWANSGMHCYLYDAMMSNIYFTDSLIWKRFFLLEIEDLLQPDILWGATPIYAEHFNTVTNRTLTIDQFRCGILISILEFSLKNFRRHQSTQWSDDGVAIFCLISAVLNNIQASNSVKV